jgi:hypothetical protein
MAYANKEFVYAIHRIQDRIVRLVKSRALNKRLIFVLKILFLAQCTDLCSGHGVIEHGQCRCQEGWHGAECQLMLNQCEIANCNNRGSCIAGKCVCQNGYQGKFCEQSIELFSN